MNVSQSNTIPDRDYLDAMVDDETEIKGLKAMIEANIREREVKQQWTRH